MQIFFFFFKLVIDIIYYYSFRDCFFFYKLHINEYLSLNNSVKIAFYGLYIEYLHSQQ